MTYIFFPEQMGKLVLLCSPRHLTGLYYSYKYWWSIDLGWLPGEHQLALSLHSSTGQWEKIKLNSYGQYKEEEGLITN